MASIIPTSQALSDKLKSMAKQAGKLVEKHPIPMPTVVPTPGQATEKPSGASPNAKT